MLAHYSLPVTVIVLKFLLKLHLEQEVTKVDLFRALLLFPIDVAFLALSFGVGILIYMQARQIAFASTEAVILIVCLYLLAIVIVIVLSKQADRAFVRDNNVRPMLLVTVSYIIALAAAAASVYVAGVI